jgi:hypothetical protein
VTGRRGKRIVVIGGIALIAAAVIVIEILRGGPAALPLRSADTPIGVVQRYLAGLASQNGSAVCATFSPALRDYIVRSAPPGRRADCTSIVAVTHFSDGDPGIDVTDIRLVGPAPSLPTSTATSQRRWSSGTTTRARRTWGFRAIVTLMTTATSSSCAASTVDR